MEDDNVVDVTFTTMSISIHILRVEDDKQIYRDSDVAEISIHILRVEDDSKNSQNNANPKAISWLFSQK